MYFNAPIARVISIEIMLSILIFTALFIISYSIFILRIRFRSAIGICKLLSLCFRYWFVLLITVILTVIELMVL
jgi:hypothetical protein